MTTPDERTRAVQSAEQFLLRIASGDIKRVPVSVIEYAKGILRHYPTRFDLSQTADELPDVWGKPYDRG